MRVCIIIPMYNEEQVARRCLDTVLEYVPALPLPTTVLVVNDGSKDRTRTIVEEFIGGRQDRIVQLLSHERNQGYGAALRSGIRFAQEQGYDYVLFMDSDLTNHPKYLAPFYEQIQRGYDYIKATRFTKGGSVEGVPQRKRVISRAGNLVAKLLFGLPIHDYTNGFRAVRVALYQQIELHENGFAIIMEELAQAARLTKSFAEVPYTLTSRGADQRASAFSYSPKTMARYLRYALRARLLPAAVAALFMVSSLQY